MKVTTFNCKHCGAKIDVPDAPGTVTCAYCGSAHRVSLRGGSVTAELVAKVKQLDEDVARLKGSAGAPKRSTGLRGRLESIEEGKRRWHEYSSSVKAGKKRESPEMTAVFAEAQQKLIEGYGSQAGPLIEDAYCAKLVGLDPPAGYSCLFILLGFIIFLVAFGAVSLSDGETKKGVILLSIGLVGIVAGIPFVIVNIKSDKADVAKRDEALRKLAELELNLRRRLGAGR
jgi:DNA-directed RNA polymerase subunit RPC12/RpoP